MPVFRIVTKRAIIQAKISVSSGLTVRIHDLHLTNFNLERIDNSHIGGIGINILKFFVTMFDTFGTPLLRFILNYTPLPLGTLINLWFWGKEWFNFKDSKLDCYDQYFILYSTPKF